MAGGHLGSRLVLSGKAERYPFHGLSLGGPGRSEVGLLVELPAGGRVPPEKNVTRSQTEKLVVVMVGDRDQGHL